MMIMKRTQAPQSSKIPMSYDRRQQVEQSRDTVQASLKIQGSVDLGTRGYQRALGNRDDAYAKLRNLNRMIQRDDQRREITESDKGIMWRQADQLRKEFLVGIPTRAEMHPAHIDLGTQKPYIDESVVNMAVQKNLTWIKKNQGKALEFKRLMRILAPDRPELANIEYHRPAGQQTSKAVVMGEKKNV